MIWRVGAIALAAAVAATAASADVGVQLITISARPGQVARARAFAPPTMPLYLVTASRAPQPYTCGNKTICTPTSLGPPSHWPYVRIHALSRVKLVVRFRIPATMRAGRYRAVLYCEPCVRGRRGSLIASGNALVVTGTVP